MDKSWIQLKDRASEEYFQGVEKFLEFAFTNDPTEKCPCRKCRNRFFLEKDEMRGHLVCNGFWQDYTYWNIHGEDPLAAPSIDPVYNIGEDMQDNDTGDDMIGMVNDALGVRNPNDVDQSPITEEVDGADRETKNLIKLINDAQRPLYDGCDNFTSLSFLIRLLNAKVTCKMTNKAITELLTLLHEAFPHAILPKSYYEAQKITSDMAFSYETWDACKNNFMIYRGDDMDLERCSICDHPRYKIVDNNKGEVANTVKKGAKRIAEKQMRYFPLKPRLKRLFMSTHTASLMRWHASEERVDDGVMRHPADSPAWKAFSENNQDFASDPRNVRLGLAADGFNPHGNMSSSYSIWPVVLIPYNLPPWLCMKKSNFILSTLIDGPDGPGDKIDVYLQPLIEELKDLWSSGVDTYDASTKQMFKLRAGLLWTINDFPAYANLSGWSTKGQLACPCCNKKTKSRWLYNCRKFCYLGHRRWLKSSHKFRRDKLAFDGEQEWDDKPYVLSGAEILEQLKDVETIYKKEDVFKRKEREAREKEEEKARKAVERRERREAQKRTRQGQVKKNTKKTCPKRAHTRKEKTDSWKKKSIFFELPYWKNNLLRHNLDVMHIEKNLCDNIIFTLLGTKGKSKDSIEARLDMKSMGIRKPLHPKEGASGEKRLPPASYTMSKAHKEIFLKVLKNVKVPDGYASNISRCVHLKDWTLKGLKSHDNHILLQQLLPLAIRKALPSKVVKVLIEVTNFFRQLCSKVNRKVDLEDIQERISLTLCHLEKIFPPSFFDIMVHLPIHLADEAMIGGPVQYRWMYPIERYLQTLKKYVRNRAHPEGSIAQGYILEECMTFCGRYLGDDVETMTNRPSRNNEGDDNQGCHFGKVEDFYLDRVMQEQAHRYVLANVDGVQQYIEKHLTYLRSKMPRASDRQLYAAHSDQFSSWLKDYVEGLESEGDTELSEEIVKLAAGPVDQARRFNGYIINGFRFRIRGINISKVTSNSGVCLYAKTRSYSSVKDKNPISGDVTFYGELIDIIEITYGYDMKFVLFKCDWVDNIKGKIKDDFNLTSVNFNQLLYKDNKVSDEPFVLASQANQVIYVKDPEAPDWSVAIKITSRDLFDMYFDDVVVVPQVQPYSLQHLEETRVVNDDESTWVREGVEETIVDATAAAAAEKYARSRINVSSESDEDASDDASNDDFNEDMEED